MKVEKSILKREEQAVFKLRGLYQHYGYLPYKMSRFEEYDLYVRNKDFLVSDKIITFADRNGKLLALKPDVTLSIIKNAQDAPGAVQKLYYSESVYRSDSASHSIKEIMQAGLECVGDLGDYEIAEVVLLAAKSMALLDKAFVLDLSHMGLVEAVLNSCAVAPDNRDAVMRCLRQKNAHELTALCPGITPQAEEKLHLLVSPGGHPRQMVAQLQAVLTTQEEFAALRELQRLCSVLQQGGFEESIRIDFSVGNDMKYYSGVVFKGYLEGLPSSILSGGQYDKLLQKMNRKSRAIGFALYLSMLERQNAAAEEWTVDTLILHGTDADPMELMAAAEAYSAEGSVLVATKIPQGRFWRRLIDMREGASAQ